MAGGHTMTRLVLAALACGLALVLTDPGAAATPPPSAPVLEAWKTFSTFHEDLARIDRARDLLETEVARAPTLEALLLLSWVHLSWSDYRATTTDPKFACYESGPDFAKHAMHLRTHTPP